MTIAEKDVQEKSDHLLPLRVSTVDQMIEASGLERGSTLLLSGGCGSGKTIFAMQSAYNAALNGERTLYLTIEESNEKIKRHMKNSFNWDIDSLEKKGMMAVKEINSIEFLSSLENCMKEAEIKQAIYGDINITPAQLFIFGKTIDLPFKPDRIIVDSISALAAMFKDKDHYRLFLKALVDTLNKNNSLNILINETEHEPILYNKLGVEEFLVDGVIGLYNIRKGELRRRAIEVVKLRSSDHTKEMVPYTIGRDGIRILRGERVY
ncbi:MAG: ATPase domain-containing protein [Candidatus Altiarchaeota archaeon]|nr:ATPase domain-containing protein [Candidatus Altiarchaeota archaeon]